MQPKESDPRGVSVLIARATWFSVALVLLLCTRPGAWALQEDWRAERPELDPYTQGDEGVMAELGIRRFGPFAFGDGRSTEEVTKETDGVPFLWIETAHFQLGCSLETLSMPKASRAKKRLQAELKQLSNHLPNLPRRPKELEPWLILHLYALRLESLYSEFVLRLGLEELAQEHPYLGSGGPICILLTEKRSTLARYSASVCHLQNELNLRSYFHRPNKQLFFGASFEALEEDLHVDAGMHFAVVHGVTRVLADAVRGYYRSLPEWFSLGLAHWFARSLVDDEILLYTTPPGEVRRQKGEADFAAKVRRRVAQNVYPSLADMRAWTDANTLRFTDHAMAWSRVDFMLRANDGKGAQAFLWAASEPVDWGDPLREERLAELRKAALVKIASGELSGLDEAWVAWVLKHYPKR